MEKGGRGGGRRRGGKKVPGLSFLVRGVSYRRFPKALAVGTKLKKKGILAEKKGKPGEGAEALGLSELKLVGVVFSSKAALIDR